MVVPFVLPKSGVKWISIPDFTAVSVFLHDRSCSLLLISLTHAHLHAHTFSLDELARYFENLEPAELPGLGGNLIWDSKARRKVNIPHKTAASINSDADRPDHHSDADGIVVDVTSVGGFIADLGTGRGQSVDLFGFF